MSEYIEVFNNAKISDQSKKTYIGKMKTLLKQFDNEIPTIDQIKNSDISINNKYMFLNTIMSYRKHANLPRENDMQEYYKEIKESLDRNNISTEKQKNNYISYKDLINKINELTENNNYYKALLLAMYIYIPPLRSNYGCVILTDNDNKNLIEAKINHIYNNKIYLYNLKVKKIDDHIIDMPDNLIEILNKSLIELPRDYLFVNNKGECMNNSQFSIFANKILKSIFNNKLTLTLLRHIYINELDMNKLNSKQKKEIANKMNHSIAQQDNYRLLDIKEKQQNIFDYLKSIFFNQ